MTTKIKTPPLLIALDTEIFDKSQFNYKAKKWMSLLSFVQEGKIKLLMTYITHCEIKIHIAEKAELIAKFAKDTAHRSYQKKFETNQNKIRISSDLLNEFKEEVQNIVYSFDKINEEIKNITPSFDEINQELQNQFEKFFKEANFEIINIDEVSVNDVFESYFLCLPPFSEKKKDEFPDAFALFALQKEAEDRNEKIYVVSGDSDWANFCSLTKSRNLCYFKNLEELLEILNKEDNPNEFEQYYSFYYEMEDEIIKGIINKLSGFNFKIKRIDFSLEWCNENIQVSDFKVEIIYSCLINIDDSDINHILVTLDLEIYVYCVATRNYIKIYEKYIKEDDDYYSYSEPIITRHPQFYNINVEITLKLSRDVDNNLSNPVIEDIYFNLDNTLDETMSDLDYEYENQH